MCCSTSIYSISFPLCSNHRICMGLTSFLPSGYLWGKQISTMLLLPSWLAQGWAATSDQPNPFSRNTPLTRVWLWLLKSDEIQNSFMIKGKLKCLVCFADFDCVDHSKLCKILKEMEIPDHLTCLLRNICAGQEATARTGHGTADWFQTGKGVCQGCILSPCLLNLYAEYSIRNARLDEAQARIKIAGRNINNFRYTDDTTLMTENEEKL